MDQNHIAHKKFLALFQHTFFLFLFDFLVLNHYIAVDLFY